jgi:hypothetical protein
MTDEVSKTRLEAQCFLQMEDLMGIFQTFDGKGALTNRDGAKTFLAETGRLWVLRHSSLQDTKFERAYALTYAVGNKIENIAIVHKIGEGFFYDVDLPRQSSVGGYFDYTKSYPTIISLLEDQIPNLLRATADSGVEEPDVPDISGD